MNTEQYNELLKYAGVFDSHLKNMQDFSKEMAYVGDILKKLLAAKEDRYIREVKLLENKLTQIQLQLEATGLLPKTDEYAVAFETLKTKLYSDDWPEALPKNLIADTVTTSALRAETIVDLVVTEYLNDVKFLDYGCGDGLTTIVTANRNTKLSVGYDIIDINQSHVLPNLLFTNDISNVIENGPYDVILLYDVLDHLTDDPIATLKMLSSLLNTNGKIYIRNHPWCSKHGGHLYESLNKAYLHIIFDEVELTRLQGLQTQHIIKLTSPVQTYREWFKASNLIIEHESIVRSDLERFFIEDPLIFNRLQKHWGVTDPTQALSIQFVDYILKANLDKQII
jgi:2-polyprenyl-3-methyl-5-hydroxy-6-metoxy-1,4-benzoquinol methylase